MDISEQLNLNTTATQEEVEPYLEETAELVQKRRSQGRIIFDRFMRNKIAVGGAVFLILLILFCFLGPFSGGLTRTFCQTSRLSRLHRFL